MAERRSLVAGLTPQSPTSAEREFVYQAKPGPSGVPATGRVLTISRTPLTTRIRDDYAKALKRASLERQMAGVTPHTLQDMLEEALGPWLRDNGYLQE